MPELNGAKSIMHLTPEEETIYETVKELMTLYVDRDAGFVTLSVLSENPEIAAIIVLNARDLLQQEVINFKIKNAREILAVTEELYAEKKKVYEDLQDKLAAFRDQHQNIRSELFINKVSRLESELAIANAINQELAKQVEQARIQISKDTPIFTIIDPVMIPNKRTSPKRTLIVLGFTFLGFFLGLSYSLIKDPLAILRKQIEDIVKTA